MLSQSSLQAFEQVFTKLIGRRLQVYEVIRNLGSATNLMISQKLNLPINCITPRTHELETLGWITCDKVDYDKNSPFSKQVTFWKVKRGLPCC